MSIYIDNTLIDMNVVGFKTTNAEYKVIFSETSYKSGVFTLELRLIDGNPTGLEIYKIISTTANILTSSDGLIDRNCAKTIIVTISGDTREIINKKTKVFTRWIKDPFKYEIIENPEYRVSGSRERTYLDTNMILITKDITSADISNCPECSNINNRYKFCPNCGYKY